MNKDRPPESDQVEEYKRRQGIQRKLRLDALRERINQLSDSDGAKAGLLEKVNSIRIDADALGYGKPVQTLEQAIRKAENTGSKWKRF